MLLYNIIPETRKALFVINFDFGAHLYSNINNQYTEQPTYRIRILIRNVY